jgi:phosphoribosylformimino-5-aminoimidazole carboxamide ribotide isomerase
MQIYPAIDLRGGKVVRLKEGDPQRQTVFSKDPLAIATDNWVWRRGDTLSALVFILAR